SGQDVAGVLSLNSQKCGTAGNSYCALKNSVGQNYALKFGTSMSAPHVSGLAAVAWTISPSATPLQIRQALIKSAAPVTSGSKNSNWGFGKASAKNISDWAKEAPGIRITSNSSNVTFRVESRDVPVSWAL